MREGENGELTVFSCSLCCLLKFETCDSPIVSQFSGQAVSDM